MLQEEPYSSKIVAFLVDEAHSVKNGRSVCARDV